MVGTWTSPRGIVYVMGSDKTAHLTVGRVAEEGVWSLKGDDLTLMLTVVNGRTSSELKARLESLGAAQTARQRRVVAELGSGEVFILSPDGRSLTKHDDAGRSVTLHKN